MIFYSDFLDSEDHLKSGSFCHFSVNDNCKFAKDGVHLNKKEVGFPLNISLSFLEEVEFIEERGQLRVEIHKKNQQEI